jgi:hypothetical protein
MVNFTAEFAQPLLEYGRKRLDPYCISFHYMVMGLSRYTAGDFPPAIELLKKSIQVSPYAVVSHPAKMLLGYGYLNTTFRDNPLRKV